MVHSVSAIQIHVYLTLPYKKVQKNLQKGKHYAVASLREAGETAPGGGTIQGVTL